MPDTDNAEVRIRVMVRTIAGYKCGSIKRTDRRGAY
jgi:hypothetical protein